MTTTQDLVAITGNTYPVKDALKSIGARWNPDRKCWMIAPAKAEEARKIVAGAGPKAASACRLQTFAQKSGWAYRHNGGVGFCGAPGCGRNGCRDCQD